MGKIVLLDDLTINQIAAGEVIERPASVVKELVENSIDAGAKNVTVEIKNGGISYIRVTDDGSGIMPDDMEIAFERHATSKIRKADDLNEVKSMGFRGEALASISAISKMEVVSRTADEEIGYKVIAEGGDIIDKHEEGSQKGTTITVKELFYNTPVRYKFLKKDFTESGYIEDIITRIALANPNIAIRLINTGKKVIQTNGNGKIEDCIYEIFGREVFDNIIPVDYKYEEYHVTGVIGKPIISRSNRTNQIFFINKRYVRNKTLTSSAEQAFKGLVTVGKHGFLVLNIDMNASKVDVNVHPTKLEVRFQEDSKVFKAVFHAIKETLLKSDLVSDPVKNYNDLTPNDILKGISNKQRVQAWDIQKSENIEENKEDKKPKFTEFRDTISGLDSETRRRFIDEITSAKTPDDLIKGAKKYSNLEKGKDTVQEDEEKYEIEENKNELDENKIENNIEDKQKLGDTEEKNPEDVSQEVDKAEDLNLENSKQEDLKPEAQKQEEQNLYDSKIEDEKNNKNVDNDAQTNNNILIKNTISEKDPLINQSEEKLSFEEMYKKLFGRDIQTAKHEFENKMKDKEKNDPIRSIDDNEMSLFDMDGNEKKPAYQFIGIAFKTYIILTMNNEMYIMDQHAAHERIMYEKVKKNYFNEGTRDCQMMLLPDVISLTNKEMGIFKDNKEMFIRAGFEVEEFGDNTVKITGVPEFCLDFNNKEIFLETLDEINTVARTARQELEDKFLATVACKAAVKAHMALSEAEVDSLMQQLLKLPNPFSCPHGRPTVIKMTKKDIEKKFSRT